MDIPADEFAKWIASGSLEDELREHFEANHHLLGLMELCNEGSPGEVEVWEVTCKVSEDGSAVTGVAKVSFQESRHMGCRDMEWAIKYSGTVFFTIDTETGEVSVTESEIQNDEIEEAPDDYGPPDSST
jgi:hypothetical protein